MDEVARVADDGGMGKPVRSGYPSDVTDEEGCLWRRIWRFAEKMQGREIFHSATYSTVFATLSKRAVSGISCPTICRPGRWFISRCGVGSMRGVSRSWWRICAFYCGSLPGAKASPQHDTQARERAETGHVPHQERARAFAHGGSDRAEPDGLRSAHRCHRTGRLAGSLAAIGKRAVSNLQAAS